MQGDCREAGGIKQDGGMMVGILMESDIDDDHTLLGIEGRLEGETIAPKTMMVRPFACPPLPSLPNPNIGDPHTMELPQRPPIRVSPLILVGGHETAVHLNLRCPDHQALTPHPRAQHSCPISSPTAELP